MKRVKPGPTPARHPPPSPQAGIARRWTLRQLLALVTVICGLLAALAQETLGTAIGVLATLAGFLLAGTLMARVAHNLWEAVAACRLQGAWTPLIRVYREVPAVSLLATLLIVAIVIGNSTVDECSAGGALLLRGSPLAFPLAWVIVASWHRSNQATRESDQ